MEQLFVSYELALKLHHKGFNVQCLGLRDEENNIHFLDASKSKSPKVPNRNCNKPIL